MATWQELSLESLASAKTLAAEGRLRNSVSRAYYAAYAAVTGELTTRGMSFAHGWNNPSHEQVPDLVGNNLPLPQATRWRLRKAIRILRRAREDADYRPGASIDRSLTTDCLRLAIFVMEALGLPQ